MKDDGTISESFLMCINFPTALRRGHYVLDPWDIDKLPESDLPVPKGKFFLLICSIQGDLRARDVNLLSNQGIVVGLLGEEAFKPILADTSLDLAERKNMIQKMNASPDFVALWRQMSVQRCPRSSPSWITLLQPRRQVPPWWFFHSFSRFHNPPYFLQALLGE